MADERTKADTYGEKGEYRIQQWDIKDSNKKEIRVIVPDVGCLFLHIDKKKPVTSINKLFSKLHQDRKKISGSYKKHFRS